MLVCSDTCFRYIETCICLLLIVVFSSRGPLSIFKKNYELLLKSIVQVRYGISNHGQVNVITGMYFKNTNNLIIYVHTIRLDE